VLSLALMAAPVVPSTAAATIAAGIPVLLVVLP
jgi:hypothetical protein